MVHGAHQRAASWPLSCGGLGVGALPSLNDGSALRCSDLKLVCWRCSGKACHVQSGPLCAAEITLTTCARHGSSVRRARLVCRGLGRAPMWACLHVSGGETSRLCRGGTLRWPRSCGAWCAPAWSWARGTPSSRSTTRAPAATATWCACQAPADLPQAWAWVQTAGGAWLFEPQGCCTQWWPVSHPRGCRLHRGAPPWLGQQPVLPPLLEPCRPRQQQHHRGEGGVRPGAGGEVGSPLPRLQGRAEGREPCPGTRAEPALLQPAMPARDRVTAASWRAGEGDHLPGRGRDRHQGDPRGGPLPQRAGDLGRRVPGERLPPGPAGGAGHPGGHLRARALPHAGRRSPCTGTGMHGLLQASTQVQENECIPSGQVASLPWRA